MLNQGTFLQIGNFFLTWPLSSRDKLKKNIIWVIMPLRTWGTYHLNYRNTNHIDYGQNVGSLAKTPPKKRNAEVGLVPGGKYRVYVGADAQAPQNSWVIFVYNFGQCLMLVGVVVTQRAYPSINKQGSDKAKYIHNSLNLAQGQKIRPTNLYLFLAL